MQAFVDPRSVFILMKMVIYGQFVYDANMKVGCTSNISIKKNATCVCGHTVIVMHANPLKSGDKGKVEAMNGDPQCC